MEWDAYRYVSVAMPDGKNAVILFAISRRHYDKGASDFLKTLKTKRLVRLKPRPSVPS